MSKILIVEDEKSIADLIAMGLKANGYEIDFALDGGVATYQDFFKQ